jgi:succinate dehydrogenase / fumarate reductase, iron-sulfur subunit
MQVSLKILRYNPEQDEKPHYKTYTVEADRKEKVLDLLHRVKWEQDGTLAFRRSCAHGICGSCAMNINGQNLLACETLIGHLRRQHTITVEPLPSLPIIKDLITDMDDFFGKYTAVKPYLINDSPPPPKERYQSQADRKRIDQSTLCIMCGACSTSCPSNWSNDSFLGPAALLKAYRFIFDSRDEGAPERLSILDHNDGVWRCHTIFNCVEACPKEIDITWHLSELKKALVGREI